tara:strand:- start:1511 stop:2242 length:732 start_codon:yes stop_codon:yes gene_type:complete
MTRLEAKKALCRKLNIDYDNIALNDLFTETDLEEYLDTAGIKAWDFAFWDVAEHSKTGTLTSDEISDGHQAYPRDIAPSSIYFLTIGGKEYKKRNLAAYKRIFIKDANDDEKVWCEYKRLIFFNTNVAQSGDTIEIYGKKTYTKLTADTDLLFFSPEQDDDEYSGNSAIVRLAYSEALASDKLKNPSQAEVEKNGAFEVLAVLKRNLEQGRATEQEQDRAMFDVPDFFATSNRSSNNVGKFSV